MTTRHADDDARSMAGFLARHERLFVLTGAGCSTASGIPDYRDADGQWKRGPPMTFQAFVADERVRQRYWARSMVGWRRIHEARPNAAHLALAELESRGRVARLVTQNVDYLHQRAGSRNVVDLHGRVDAVRCLDCDRRTARSELQERLVRQNPAFAGLDAAAAPDGDADLDDAEFSRFEVPDCDACGGLLKPDVVLFGERVPPARVELAMATIGQSDAMLVVGSSLMVFSGFRFARAMAEADKPVAAINIGRTRADEFLTLKIDAPCAAVLARLLPACAAV